MRAFFSNLLLFLLVFYCTGTCLAQSKRPLSVAVIMDSLNGDKGFVDSIQRGYQIASNDFDVEVRAFYHRDPVQQKKLFTQTASGEYDLIIIASAELNALARATALQYPKKHFAIVDSEIALPNVMSVVFEQKEASFLAGVAAAMFALSSAPHVSGKKLVGWVGGIAQPQNGLHEFLDGYTQGVKAVDPQITVLTGYVNSFDNPVRARAMALDQYRQGASVIMHAAGRSGLGVFQAAKETGNYAIGADSNQDGLLPGQIITSVIKRMDIAIYLLIKRLADKKFNGNETVRMTLRNNGVGLTDMKTIREALDKNFPPEIPGRVSMYRKQLENGTLKL